MSKETKNMLVPKLRFPEFQEAGDWEEKSLFEIAEIKGRIGYRGYTINDIVKKGDGAISLSPSNINEDGFLNYENSTYISWEKYEESPEIMISEGFTVLVKTASVGKTAFVKELPEKTTINPQLVVFKPIEIDPFFLALLISHSGVQKQVRDAVGAGAIPNLSQESISKFKVFIPCGRDKNEQHKIADCLSSLDELITSQSQKLETLKAHRKGLMQQLFPAEGETVPKRRFKEFEGSVEWEENVLAGNQVALFINEKISLNELKLGAYISTENMLSNYGGVTVALKLPRSGSFTRFDKGDILISNIRPYLKKVWFSNMEGAASNDVLVIRADSLIVKSFLSYLLKNDAFINYIMKGAEGVKMPRGDKALIREYKIMFPSPDEQQKIADCLSSLDELIIAQTEKIEELKRHKKGLMQGLFPIIN